MRFSALSDWGNGLKPGCGFPVRRLGSTGGKNTAWQAVNLNLQTLRRQRGAFQHYTGNGR
jgi:hypothetical protein